MIYFLAGYAAFAALILLLIKNDKSRDIFVRGSAAILALVSIYFFMKHFPEGEELLSVDEKLSEIFSAAFTSLSTGIGIIAIIIGIKYKKLPAVILALIQTPLMLWFELGQANGILVRNAVFLDKISLIMILIIGIVGSLIAVYACSYMKAFEEHRRHDAEEKGEEYKDRRPWFFFLMFIFLSAMYGIVCSNNLLWFFCFWEITTLCSFFLIGYTRSEEAINNSFLALELNLIGGIALALGIIYFGSIFGSIELSDMVMLGKAGYGYAVTVPAALLSLAALTKAAQMPFNKWLLGAMVAPTPTSALLHSSTMVKAGVFLILKISPCLGTNLAGIMTLAAGGATFLFASFAAISQSNAKRVLAYSTIANLGLIVICGAIGSYASVWAGVFLLIFHACTKSLLFLSVGTAEHNIGSRDIEDMDGLFTRLPHLSVIMITGISAMFLAPLGMLISKWAAMVAFIDSGMFPLIAVVAFGSAATCFYWAKWLGKLTAGIPDAENTEGSITKGEWFVLYGLAFISMLLCVALPWISKYLVIPYLQGVFGFVDDAALSDGNLYIMSGMFALVILLPILLFRMPQKRIALNYMSGVNMGDDLSFRNSFQQSTRLSLRNWYMEDIFDEKKMNLWGSGISAAAILLTAALILGQLIGMGGGF